MARSLSATLALLALSLTTAAVAGACVQQQENSTTCSIPLESASCIPIDDSSRCVRSFFAGGLEPQVGYPGCDDWRKTLSEKKSEFGSLGLGQVVCDAQCFSNLPNLASFLTFLYFPPCTVDENGRAIVITPCRSLCEAARKEYARHGHSPKEITRVCLTAANINATASSVEFGSVLNLKTFNCSRYSTRTDGRGCVPERPAINVLRFHTERPRRSPRALGTLSKGFSLARVSLALARARQLGVQKLRTRGYGERQRLQKKTPKHGVLSDLCLLPGVHCPQGQGAHSNVSLQRRLRGGEERAGEIRRPGSEAESRLPRCARYRNEDRPRPSAAQRHLRLLAVSQPSSPVREGFRLGRRGP